MTEREHQRRNELVLGTLYGAKRSVVKRVLFYSTEPRGTTHAARVAVGRSDETRSNHACHPG